MPDIEKCVCYVHQECILDGDCPHSLEHSFNEDCESGCFDKNGRIVGSCVPKKKEFMNRLFHPFLHRADARIIFRE